MSSRMRIIRARIQFRCIASLLMTSFIGTSQAVAANGRMSDTVECYSCMSAVLSKSWERLKDIYYEPLNFTDDCNSPFRGARLKTVVCHYMCVTIIEAVYMSGVPAAHNYIRGCLHHIAKGGFNNQTLRKMGFDYSDYCDKVPRSSLFKNKLFSIDDHVMLCTCWGDKCNRARPNNALRPAAVYPLIGTSILLFLYFGRFSEHFDSNEYSNVVHSSLIGCAILFFAQNVF